MSKTIAIWIEGGCCLDVFNLPKGWNYEVVDTDTDDEAKQLAAYAKLAALKEDE